MHNPETSAVRSRGGRRYLFPAVHRRNFSLLYKTRSATTAMSSGSTSSGDLDQPRHRARLTDTQTGHADWEFESAWSGAAWVQVENTAAPFDGRFMRMATDDHIDFAGMM